MSGSLLLDESFHATLRSASGEPLVLQHVEITGDLRGAIFDAHVRQTFINPSTEHLEAIYSFPLPWRALRDRPALRSALAVRTRRPAAQNPHGDRPTLWRFATRWWTPAASSPRDGSTDRIRLCLELDVAWRIGAGPGGLAESPHSCFASTFEGFSGQRCERIFERRSVRLLDGHTGPRKLSGSRLCVGDRSTRTLLDRLCGA